MHSFRTRILLLVLGIAAVPLGTILYALTQQAERAATRQAATELRAGAAVARKTLEFRGQQLANSAHILAADFGFRAAVTSDDAATLQSALANHAARMKADLAAAFDTDGKLLATIPANVPSTAATALRDAKDAAHERVIYGVVDGSAYQLVAATVYAPEPVAFVLVGFALNADLARDISNLVAVDVAFAWRRGSRFDFAASTNPSDVDLRVELAEGGRGTHIIATRGDKSLVQREPLPIADGELDIVLRSTLDVTGQSFWQLRNTILLVGGCVLLIAVAGGALLARAATKPISLLTAAAERIEHGDYSPAVSKSDALEFRKLGAAFTAMRNAVADREQRILHQAQHDALTGLVNRNRIHELIVERIAASADRPFALCLIDIDQLGTINASFGHSLGDRLVIDAAKRLASAVPEAAVVARIGVRQFLILLPECRLNSGLQVATGLLACLRDPIEANGIPIRLTARAGLATYPLDGINAEDLMRRADLALLSTYKSAAAVGVFDAEAEAAHRRRIQVLGELQHGIEAGQLRLVYQPKLDLRTRTLTNCEVLVRWRHPVHGDVPPSEFIPHAERTGSIRHLTSWTLAATATQLAQWNAAGYALEAAVNLSAADIADPHLATEIEALLKQHEIPGEQLIFEITEGVAMSNIEEALRAMQRLRQIGIRFAIDDFGTGYSSLAQLSRLPVDELKLDGSLVKRLTEDERARVVVRAMVELGHSLGLRLVAEGVENLQLMRSIAKLGCDVAQGYAIAKPLTPDALLKWLDVHRLPKAANMESTMVLAALVRDLAGNG